MMPCQKLMMMKLLLMMNKWMWMQLRMMSGGYIVCRWLFMWSTIKERMLLWLLHMCHLKSAHTEIGRVLLNMRIHWVVCFHKICHSIFLVVLMTLVLLLIRWYFSCWFFPSLFRSLALSECEKDWTNAHVLLNDFNESFRYRSA